MHCAKLLLCCCSPPDLSAGPNNNNNGTKCMRSAIQSAQFPFVFILESGNGTVGVLTTMYCIILVHMYVF